MSIETIEKVYNSYAGVYDVIFGRLFQPGRLLTTSLVNKHAEKNAKILEVGVGTGLSLPHYRPDLKIMGIDVSKKMLEKAEKRVAFKNIHSQVTLKQMDAAKLTFPDDSFDFIVAMYVASVVDNINDFLNEITRVCKPGGYVVIVNHFTSDNLILRHIEKTIAKVQNTIGFKADFPLDAVLQYPRLQLLKSSNTNLFGYWKLLHLIKP